MERRVAVSVVILAVALVLSYSVVALASPPGRPAGAVQATQSEPPSITAIGIGVTAGPGGDVFLTPQTLFVSVQSKASAADLESATADMRTRLATLRAGLETLGVPAAAIQLQGISLQPQYAPPAGKGGPGPQPALGFAITSNIQAEITDPKLLVPAINSLTANGATSVSSGYGKGGPSSTVQPSADDLQRLAAEALASARETAAALAVAGGTRLGALRSVSSQQIYPDCCPPGNGWRMVLTATYDVAP
ncbi:MAG: SIMPL domain-containing protein [Candidatus Limnocylindria bacterium]